MDINLPFSDTKPRGQIAPQNTPGNALCSVDALTRIVKRAGTRSARGNILCLGTEPAGDFLIIDITVISPMDMWPHMELFF